MPQNVLACDREQELLLPPSLREWLPDDHFAWFVIDAVAEMDLAAFYVAYRADGHGRAAHDPAMLVVKRRLEEEHEVECRANADYETYRARGRRKDGRRFGRPPNPCQPPQTPAGKIPLTDRDSGNVKTARGWVQGYNAQAVCTEQQIVIAAEVTVDSPDFGHLGPMVSATASELATAGITTTPEVVLADAGYWHQAQMENITGGGTVVLIPPDAGKRKGARPGCDGDLYAPDGPLPTPRQIGRPLRMAAYDRDPQPPEALQAHHLAAGGLSRPPAIASHQPTSVPAGPPAINRLRASAFAATFAQRPPTDATAAWAPIALRRNASSSSMRASGSRSW